MGRLAAGLVLLACLVGRPSLAASVVGARPPAAATPAILKNGDAERIRIGDSGLTGVLFRPKGNGTGPFPAVVALHGCEGLMERDGQMAAREADWGQKLAASGFLVLFPDSFGFRKLGPQCRAKEGSAQSSAERRKDAHAARRWLQAQPSVKPKAVSLMGWSSGATAVLLTVRTERLSRPGRGFRVIGPDFARAVALYPKCRMGPDQPRLNPRMPLLIAIGAQDDWVSPHACEQIAHEGQEAGKITLITYPGAYHNFDAPNQPVRIVKGLPRARGGTRQAHEGTDAAARADIMARVPDFLAR